MILISILMSMRLGSLTADALIIATTALNVFKNLCVLLSPVIPYICKQMLSMLNIDNFKIVNLENELVDTKIGDFQPILSRVKPLNIQDFYKKEEKMKDEDNIIQIDDFMKIDLQSSNG